MDTVLRGVGTRISYNKKKSPGNYVRRFPLDLSFELPSKRHKKVRGFLEKANFLFRSSTDEKVIVDDESDVQARNKQFLEPGRKK